MVNVITRRRTAVTVAAGALLATLAPAPGARAATYYACVKRKGGAIRIVSRTTKCRRSERKISFNSQGAPGANGSNGRNGRNGANGINGTNGTNGSTGFTSTLPSGQTEYGTWAANPAKALDYVPVSFPIPLASPAQPAIIGPKGPSTSACPGTPAAPQAASGHLCVYAAAAVGVKLFQFSPTNEEGEGEDTRFGEIVGVESVGPASTYAWGTWAVTG
jgi:hypothetical protein